MKTLNALAVLVALAATAPPAVRAEDGLDPAKATAFEGETLQGGADNKVFRVDRVDNRECAGLLTNRGELAELKPQK
jgi:hypothetical protein